MRHDRKMALLSLFWSRVGFRSFESAINFYVYRSPVLQRALYNDEGIYLEMCACEFIKIRIISP